MAQETFTAKLFERLAYYSKAAFDTAIASRDARIAQLESDVETLKAQIGKRIEGYAEDSERL